MVTKLQIDKFVEELNPTILIGRLLFKSLKNSVKKQKRILRIYEIETIAFL